MEENPLRQALWPLSLLYGAATAARNWTFDAGLRAVHRIDAFVVSVGNLTVGGTGKTPTVLWLAELAHRRGKRVGVLARGYGRAPGQRLNDEGAMLQARLPWLRQEQDPDRVAGGRRLTAAGADYVVLDDGFQHRRLHRDVDLLCLDARLPFGNGQCLPAGNLREFRSGLRRASVVLLTRAGALDDAQFAARQDRIRGLARQPRLAVHACDHAPLDLVHRPDGAILPLASLQDRPVVLLSAIAKPASFRATVETLGATVVREFRHRDHHRFTAAELAAAAQAARQQGALLVTTEKDDARIRADGEGAATDVERHVLRIGLHFPRGEPAPAEVGL